MDVREESFMLPNMSSPSTTAWEEVLRAMNEIESLSSVADTLLPTPVTKKRSKLPIRRRYEVDKGSSFANGVSRHQEASSTVQLCSKRRKQSEAADVTSTSPKFEAPRRESGRDSKLDLQTSGLLHTQNMCPKLSWQGKLYIPVEGTAHKLSRIIADPIPVRIPRSAMTAVAQSSRTPPPINVGDWLLGLAITSYVDQERQQLKYVVLLDHGAEVHVPWGSVEHIMVIKEAPVQPKTTTVSHSKGISSWCPTSSLSVPMASSDAKTSLQTMDLPLQASSSQHSLGIEYSKQGSHVLPPTKIAFAEQSGAATSASNMAERISVELEAPRQHLNFNSWQYADFGSDNILPTFSDSFMRALLYDDTDEQFQRHCSTSMMTAGQMLDSGRYRCEEVKESAPAYALGMPGGQVSGPSASMPCNVASGDVHSSRPLQQRIPIDGGGPFKRPLDKLAHDGPAMQSVSDSVGPVIDEARPGQRQSRTRQPEVQHPRPDSRAELSRAFAREYAEATWTNDHVTYAHDPVRFRGPVPSPTFPYRKMPSKLSLFGRFWSEKTLERICDETNRYASFVDSETRLPVGGAHWWALTPTELCAFFGVCLLMGLKKEPNHRSYWNKEFPFFYCDVIARSMSRCRFEDLTRCLHICDDTTLDRDHMTSDALKLSKLGWLITEIQGKCKVNWNLHQQVTVDEAMIRYKGKYCPVRQYIPKKPTKWGIKVWCIANAQKKYIYNFDIYTGAARRGAGRRGARNRNGGRGAKTAYEVVMLMMTGLHGRGHVVVTDCYFSSVKLTVDLAALGTYAAGTVMSNRVGLPRVLSQRQLFVGEPQGTVAWRMHRSRKISCVVWVDRRPVLLVSSFFTPIPRLGEPWPTVPRRIHGEEEQITTSPIHKGYTDFMRGVDVADQMRGTYSSQSRSQKWWHRILFFLLDMSVVNAYILYDAISERLVVPARARRDFQLMLCEALCKPWSEQRGCVSKFRLTTPGVHNLIRTPLRRKCRFCMSAKRTNFCCAQCGGIYLHMGVCFRSSHYCLRN